MSTSSKTATATASANGGTSILGLLGITFVVLKLIGVIDWSWWLVTLPFWGGLVFLAIIGLIGLLVWATIRYGSRLIRRLRRRR